MTIDPITDESDDFMKPKHCNIITKVSKHCENNIV